MANIISSITEGNKTALDSRTNVDLNGEAFGTFKFKTETITPKIQAIIIYTRSVAGDILIWDNPEYGIWDTSLWGGDLTSEQVISRIVPPEDTFEEPFLSTIFINTSETTATIGTEIWT
jgi:hypothetical protein